MRASTLNFDIAVTCLDDFLRTKTVHSVKSIMDEMRKLCNEYKWDTVEDHQDFANICSNFEKYCMIKKQTSFGRKQFEAAWEKNFGIEDSLQNAVSMLVNRDVLQEDDLPDFGVPIEDASPNDLQAIVAQLEEENEHLKLEIIELRKSLKEIGKLVNPWA